MNGIEAKIKMYLFFLIIEVCLSKRINFTDGKYYTTFHNPDVFFYKHVLT